MTGEETKCPTPRKSRFATVEAAESAAERAKIVLGKVLQPYDNCPCGWVHLTSKRATDLVQPRPLEEIRNLNEEDFAQFVRDEVRGLIHPREAEHLRTSVLLLRWKDALKSFSDDLTLQLEVRKDERTVQALDWRKRVVVLRRSLNLRTEECKRLRSGLSSLQYHATDDELEKAIAARKERHRQKDLREQAGDVAVNRLIQAHQKEFTTYLIQEYEKVGADIPPRILRYAERHAAEKKEKAVTQRATYNVLAVPEGEKFWVVRILGLPEGTTAVTQALQEKGEQDIEAMARDCIALQLEVDEDSFDLAVIVQKPDPELADRLSEGMRQAERGETHYHGDFGQSLEENEGDKQ